MVLTLGGVGLGLALNLMRGEEVPQKVIEEQTVKKLEVLEFGMWKPTSSREVLGTVQSSGDLDITAEVTGTLQKVLVDIGDKVEEGQILARFDLVGDRTQVAYENARRNLNATQQSSQNTIRAAEIAVESAERELQQTLEQEEQDRRKVFEELRVNADNAMTKAQQALDWSDRIVGATTRFRSEQDADRRHIGRTNRVLRQSTKNEALRLFRSKDQLPIPPGMGESPLRMIPYAQARIHYTQEIRALISQMDTLVRGTTITQTFSRADRDSFEASSEALATAIDTQLLTLETKTQAARSEKETNRTTIISAQNRLKNAEAQLELQQSNAGLQISRAQNEVWLANTSQQDLLIRAPFAGLITDKSVSSFDQVKVGDQLFSLVAGDVTPKVVAFVTPSERDRLQSASEIILELSDKRQITTKNIQLSFKTGTKNQKQKLELLFEEFPNIPMGTFVKILVPADGLREDLLPLSAFAFEPGGAEVLILKDGKAQRKQILYGDIFSNAVEVLEGLEKGDQVIRHRNRAFSGELIESLHP